MDRSLSFDPRNPGECGSVQDLTRFDGSLNGLGGRVHRQMVAAAADNAILAGLDSVSAECLFERARIVQMEPNVSLTDPGREVTHVYFPLDVVCALVSSFEDGRCVEMGMIGREGLVGVSPLLGSRQSVQRVTVQIGGSAIRVPVPSVLRVFESDAVFRKKCLQFVNYLFGQVAQSAACNRSHLLQPRLCRWLLTLRDRIGVREVDITHEAIGQMLGANRSDISRAIAPLRTNRSVAMVRGKLVILDRHVLLKRACECYSAVHST